MKKLMYMAAAALIVVAGIFWGCQKEDTLTNPEEGLMLKSLTLGGDCNTVCIDENSGDEYAATDSKTETGNGKNAVTNTLSVKVWNTLSEINYEFTSLENGPLQYFDEQTNEWIQLYGFPQGGGTWTLTRALAPDWEACDVVTEQFRMNGNPNIELDETNYSLIGPCEVGCDESFSYVDNQDGTLTFTYIPAEDMTDVNVVFTFPQVEYITFLSGYEYESFVRPGNGNAQNMQADLSFDACVEYTWTIQLVDCTAANATANGWTDFKVDDISKKNENTPNFTYTCPLNE
uniref:hypothetical protein n=1 Tax=uncultured Draconibacterium sp. TaxID=1573823 RepID=UPI003216DEB8